MPEVQHLDDLYGRQNDEAGNGDRRPGSGSGCPHHDGSHLKTQVGPMISVEKNLMCILNVAYYPEY